MAITLQQQMLELIGKHQANYGAPISFHDTIDDTKEEYERLAKQSKPIKDSYENTLLSIGNADKVESFTNYGFSNNTLNWPLWLALYNDSWIFRRAIDKPATDEISCGIKINGDSDYGKVYREYKKCQTDLIQLLQWGALFGGSIAVVMFDNFKDEDYQKSIEQMKQKIKESKTTRMYVADRWYGVVEADETVEDMTDLDFGKPKAYKITFANGNTMLIHHDYILRYEHRVAPKLVKNGQLQGWGYAEGAHILNELSRDDKLKASIQSLVDKSLIEVIKMPGMRGVYLGGDKDNNEQMTSRLEMVNWGRNFNSLTFLDKDDEYQQNTFSGLGGLSDILAQNMWLVAAALEMDNYLFGDLKGGLSQDDNAMERYSNTIHGRCEAYARPVVEKWLQLTYLRLGIDERIDFEFNSLIMKKQDNDRLDSLKSFQQLLSGMLTDGVITLKQYAMAVQNYTTKGTLAIQFTEKDIDSLDDKMEEEMENINIDEPEENKKGLKGRFSR